MKKLLESSDLISLEHLPVQDLINFCYTYGVFKRAVECSSTGIGFGTDFGGFTFWSDLDEYDKTFYEEEFIGIEIECGDNSVIIYYDILFHYLKLAVKRYIEQNPHDEQEVEKYLEDMKRNLNIEEKI